MAPKQSTLNDTWSAPNKRRRTNPSKESTIDDNKANKKQKSEKQPNTSHTKSSSKSELTPKTSTSNPTLTLTHTQASLFDSPPNTLLCHATNAQGSWGAGIAAAFKKSYPSAFKVYTEHCKSQNTSNLLGTALLIPPQNSSSSNPEREASHWVGCLFTSERRGKGKGSKESILQATDGAVRDLLRQVRQINDEEEGGSEKKEKTKAKGSGEAGTGRIGEVRMCKINSGLFGVPWEETCEVIEGIEVGDGDVREIAVLSLD